MPTSTSDPRGHRELVNAHTVASEHVPASGWAADASVRVLSANPLSGAFSGLLQLPKSFRRPAGWFGADTEWLVLSGWLWVGRELRSYGTYGWAPAGSAAGVLAESAVLC